MFSVILKPVLFQSSRREISLNFLHKLNEISCINIYAHSCLKPLSNSLKAVFKQLEPCSNHGIHVLFELGFYLKILKKEHRLLK